MGEIDYSLYTSNITRATSLKNESLFYFHQLFDKKTLEEIKEMIFSDNVFAKRALSTKKAIWNAIIRRFSFVQGKKLELTKDFFSSNISDQTKYLIIFYFLAKSERIIYDLSVNLTFNLMLQGLESLPKNEVKYFLKKSKTFHPELEKWSESTFDRVSTHYLCILRDFNFLEGIRKKFIKKPLITSDFIFFLLKYIEIDNGDLNDIFENSDFKLFFLTKNEVQNYLETLQEEKKLAYEIKSSQLLIKLFESNGDLLVEL